MFRLLKSTFLLVSVFCTLTSVNAQSIPGVTQPVTFQVSSEFPAPNTNVTVTTQSYSTDLNRATFIWYVNGKIFKQGTGITSVTIPSGKAGTQTTISVEVATPDIGTFTNEVTIRPAEVTLLWKSDGYVPPFYKGKALEAYGASFKVVAIPEFFTSAGTRIDPKNLVYTWMKNDNVEAAQSGYGKDSFTSTQSSYVRGGDSISVEVSTADRQIGASQMITISPTLPDILFYEHNPLYGVLYEHSLGETFDLAAEEITIRAEPYNISVGKTLSGELAFDWSMNNQPVAQFKDKNQITLRKTGVAGGETNLFLLLQHNKKILQGGQVGITIFQ